MELLITSTGLITLLGFLEMLAISYFSKSGHLIALFVALWNWKLRNGIHFTGDSDLIHFILLKISKSENRFFQKFKFFSIFHRRF